jgi:hypothetical protein
MTDSAESRAERRGTRRLPGWLGWPITFGLAVAGAVGFYNDAITAKLEWLYWVLVLSLALFYFVVLAFYLTRLTRWLWRRWRVFAEKARQFDDKSRQLDEKAKQFDDKSRKHDALQAELETWKAAAGEATARADDAEDRVKTWHLNSMREGRQRLLREMRASVGRTIFRKIEVAVAGDVLVIGAKWSGDPPNVDARYIMRSTTLKEPKAMLECVEIRENKTAVFRVSSSVSEIYKSNLVKQASTTESVLADVEIAPRVDDELEEEAIWPEN